MKSDKNGVSTCPPGAEQYETFSRLGKVYFQYDYRHPDGELFSTVKTTLAACRRARKAWLIDHLSKRS